MNASPIIVLSEVVLLGVLALPFACAAVAYCWIVRDFERGAS